MENVLEIKNISKNYKGFSLKDVSFNIPKGFVMGLIGPNGAGKTTTIKAIMNLINLDSGEIYIFGEDIKKNEISIKDRIGFVYDDCCAFEDFTIKENKKIISKFYSKWDEEKFKYYVEKFELNENKKLKQLSKGQKMRFSLALALSHKAELLILDEPTNGLDPLMQKKLFNILIEEKEKGNTVFLSSHNLVEVQNLCDRVCVIKEGKIVDIIEIEKSKTELKLKVTLSSSDITDDIVLNLSDKILDKNGKLYTFICSKNIDSLVKELANYKIDELLIEKENLEDAFLNYYENNKEEV